MQNHPIICVEGPDGTGKSTLAQNLAQYMGGKHLHLTYRWPAKMHHYHQAAMELALRWSEHQPVILDRWWPSEVVYAAAFRGGTPWPMASRMLDRVALKHGVLYVLCMPQDKGGYLDFYEHTKAATEDVVGPRERLFDLYETWFARQTYGRHDVVRYDLLLDNKNTFHENLAFIAKQRLKALINFNRLTLPDHQDRRFAGSVFNGRILLIGDQSNPKSRRPAWPFFEHANSSLWLTTKLEELCLPEHRLMWLNLHGPDRRPQVTHEELLDLWHRAEIKVALGNNVYETLRKFKVEPTFVLNHPQYYRRFKPSTDALDFLGTLYPKDPNYASASRDLGLVQRSSRPNDQGQAEPSAEPSHT